MRNDYALLEGILESECITPVYQPIVSLTDGQTYGYEALSRISREEFAMNIEQMFKTADRMQKSWELEALCRTKALKNSVGIAPGKKLFLNVNPNIIHAEQFGEGFTKNRLNEYGLDYHSIIFEITERVAILDNNAFLVSIEHYRNQNYGIAIDDVGAGYSGLSTIANIRPNIMKLDMSLVRDIDQDETKQFLCKAMVEFGKNAGILLLAEGIETEDELRAIIKLKVDLGQGYFLGVPQQVCADIAPHKIEMINKYHAKQYTEKTRSSVYPIIGHLSKKGHCFAPHEKAEHIYKTLHLDPTITDFTVVKGGTVTGFMSRTTLNEIFGGRYGFSLHSQKTIQEMVKNDFLRVNYQMPVDQVSRIAMQRPFEQLYDPVVVERDGKYAGVVTIRDLLNKCTKIEVDIAIQSNPLTGLPGNLLIEKEILNRIFGSLPYCILYFDLDSFKAYNDAYGFKNGDKILAFLADVLKMSALKNEFVGHIGGDDFIVVCDYHEGDDFCREVIRAFAAEIATFYRDEDVKNGYIISKNRHGVTEKFPLATLSIAGISNKTNTYQNIDDFSKDIAVLKKKCKKHEGNYYEIR